MLGDDEAGNILQMAAGRSSGWLSILRLADVAGGSRAHIAHAPWRTVMVSRLSIAVSRSERTSIRQGQDRKGPLSFRGISPQHRKASILRERPRSCERRPAHSMPEISLLRLGTVRRAGIGVLRYGNPLR